MSGMAPSLGGMLTNRIGREASAMQQWNTLVGTVRYVDGADTLVCLISTIWEIRKTDMCLTCAATVGHVYGRSCASVSFSVRVATGWFTLVCSTSQRRFAYLLTGGRPLDPKTLKRSPRRTYQLRKEGVCVEVSPETVEKLRKACRVRVVREKGDYE